MNSQERHELRYQRRKAKREEHKRKKFKKENNYDELFSYQNLFEAFDNCRKGVNWKGSIQRYGLNRATNTYVTYNKLKQRNYKTKGFTEFTICERGKMRDIKSVHISERCVHNVLSNKCLVPILSNGLIYDNGASLKGKGVSFTLNELKKHLRRHYINHGTNGGILTYDFTNFFGSINHEKLINMISKLVYNEDLQNLITYFIKLNGDRGLGLGSQIFQICAVAYPNRLDHYFKDTLRIKGYARYMDDGYIIHEDINKLKEFKYIILEIAKELDLQINPKKFKLTKFGDNGVFTFLQKKIKLSNTGKIVMRVRRKAVTRVRRKFKKLYKRYINGDLDYKSIAQAYTCHRNIFKTYNNYHNLKSLDNLFNDLFINPFIESYSVI